MASLTSCRGLCGLGQRPSPAAAAPAQAFALAGAGPAARVARRWKQPAASVPSPSSASNRSSRRVEVIGASHGTGSTLAATLFTAGVAAVGAARARARRCRGRLQVVARRGRSSISFESLYNPLDDEGDGEEDSGEQDDDGGQRRPGRRAAKWKRENAELREDPSYTKEWVWDPKRRGAKFRKYAKGVAIDRVQELDDRASSLRALYKRPRFGWKEVMKDDLRTEALSENLPAIGTGQVWLSKYLAHTGSCSRRKVKEMVLQGRVQVNGQVVTDVVMQVNPKRDSVFLDGQRQDLTSLGEIIWIMLNKPKGVISTFEDSEGRKTVTDLVPFAKQRRLVPIGRIDRNAQGLMILTNDYEWHTILAHPRYDHTKRYKVELYNGVPARAKLQAIQNGLELPDESRPLRPLEDFEVVQNNNIKEIATVKFSMREGRYRQIRRMFEYLGHPVKSIKRTEFGLLKLDRELKNGDWRQLTAKEIRRLKGPTILKRPQKHPYDMMRQQGEMEDRLDEATIDEDEGFPGSRGGRGRRDRGGDRKMLGRGQAQFDDGDDEFSGGFRGRGGRRDDRTPPGRSQGRSRGRSFRGERTASRGIDEGEWDDGDGGFDGRRPARGGRRAAPGDDWGREQPREQGQQRKLREVSFFQAGKGGDFADNVRSRIAEDLGRAGGKDRRAREPEEQPQAREASMEDLQRLQQRFDQVSAKSSGPAPPLDSDWEADWVKQLDAMQEDKRK